MRLNKFLFLLFLTTNMVISQSSNTFNGFVDYNYVSRTSDGSTINLPYRLFGININQVNFINLPNASSLKSITKKNYDLNNFTKILIKKLKKNNFFVPFFTDIETLNQENLISKYNNKLYCRKKLKSFKLSNGKIFHGNIESVDINGILNVKEKNHSILRSFSDKEIQIII